MTTFGPKCRAEWCGRLASITGSGAYCHEHRRLVWSRRDRISERRPRLLEREAVRMLNATLMVRGVFAARVNAGHTWERQVAETVVRLVESGRYGARI